MGPVTQEEEKRFYFNSKSNKLDRTDIHPESYDLAKQILKIANTNVDAVGNPEFARNIMMRRMDLFRQMTSNSDVSNVTVNQVLDSLCKPLNYDLRNEVSKTPLFRKGMTNMYDLKIGMTLTGCIRNVCDFGCFVDIGVGQDGLIHKSKMNGFTLKLGDTAEVEVVNIDLSRKRIGLSMIKRI